MVFILAKNADALAHLQDLRSHCVDGADLLPDKRRALFRLERRQAKVRNLDLESVANLLVLLLLRKDQPFLRWLVRDSIPSLESKDYHDVLQLKVPVRGKG